MSKVMAFIISPGEEWDNYLDIFNDYELNDIYFHYDYLNLFVDDNSKAVIESYVFRLNGEIFFMPYIRNPINGSFDLWDFETAYGYSGPISTCEDKVFLDLAWKNFKLLLKENKVIAGLIRFNPLLKNEKFCHSDYIKINHERDTVWLDCNRSLDEVLSDYSKKHLKQLNTLNEKGVLVKSCNNDDYLKKFAHIYIQRMNAIGARDEYHYSSDYFDKVKKLGKRNWIVYLAFTPNEDLMGGCLLLFSNKTCHYHLSGSLEKYKKYRPNDMLRYKVTLDILNSDIKKMHFGGGRSKDPDDGLLAFKLKFSKQISQFKIGCCIVDKDKYNELCKNWDKENPEKKEFANFFLKYRF